MAMHLLPARTQSRKFEAPLLLVLPAAGLLLLLLFGIAGALQRDPSHIDMDVFYGAGTWYLEGVSPYGELQTPPQLQGLGLHLKAYAYAPHFVPFTMALAKLDYGTARIAWSVLNLAAAIGLAAVIIAMMREEPARVRTDPLAEAVAAFLILGSPFVATVLWLGNTSIIIAACLSAGWWLDRRGHPLAAGVLLALAMIKPQFAVLPLLWLAGERRWKTLAACAATCAALYSYHAVAFGPLQSIRDWVYGVAVYQSTERPPGFEHLFGMSELIGAAGFPSPQLWPLLVPLLAAAWMLRDRLTRLETLAILCGFAALLLPVRDYDLVTIAPLIGALAARARGSHAASVMALAAIGLFYMPQRALRSFDSALLLQWRVVVLLFLVCGLVMLAARRADSSAATRTLPGIGSKV
jgi:hypothetical protein